MFTTNFKVTVGTLAAVIVAGALGVNQLSLEQKVNDVQKAQAPHYVVITATPTATPSATPTIVLYPKYKTVLTIAPTGKK